MATVSIEDKVKIASDFLLSSPPGEVNDVFNDVRMLVDDDDSLQEGILQALERYNTEQHVTVRPPGLEYDVVLSKYGKIEQDRFLDPRSKKTFKVDHMRLTASDLEDDTTDTAFESLRSNVEKECIAYIEDHFPNGICSVYIHESEIAIAIVDNKYNPNNFWNGRWLASWVYDTQSGDLKGMTKVNVHYYEDGNVQLKADKEASLHVDMKDVSRKNCYVRYIIFSYHM
ncbi:F-actin-capping protein subunit alpha [Choanephora cucurbitarum]|nr:F-actin-capping protein subunit alpha [Choanephora cucurbitarum]